MNYQIEQEIIIDFEWEGVNYKTNITPILNSLIKFVMTILDAYLPDDIKSVL